MVKFCRTDGIDETLPLSESMSRQSEIHHLIENFILDLIHLDLPTGQTLIYRERFKLSSSMVKFCRTDDIHEKLPLSESMSRQF